MRKRVDYTKYLRDFPTVEGSAAKRRDTNMEWPGYNPGYIRGRAATTNGRRGEVKALRPSRKGTRKISP